MAKVGVALTTGQTGGPPPSSAVPMKQDLPGSATPGKDAAGTVSGAGTAVEASSTEAEAQTWVQPQSFKTLVGKGHADFSSGHQQVPAQRVLSLRTDLRHHRSCAVVLYKLPSIRSACCYAAIM